MLSYLYLISFAYLAYNTYLLFMATYYGLVFTTCLPTYRVYFRGAGTGIVPLALAYPPLVIFSDSESFHTVN